MTVDNLAGEWAFSKVESWAVEKGSKWVAL